MPDLKPGESAEVPGSGGRTYVIKNSDGDYSCTCMAWKHQSASFSRRTCKHLKRFRGEQSELERTTIKEPVEPDIPMPRVLTTTADISAAIETLCGFSRLWLDTEIAEYWIPQRRRLSLIQALADGVKPNTKEVIILDVIDQPSLATLFVDRVMKNPSIQKVFHNASFDLDYLGGDDAVNVFCTCNESKVLPESRVSLPSSKSLKSLHEHFGLGEVDKEGQKSDWQRRPLAGWQLKYAALDVVQLRGIHLKLIQLRKWLDDTNAWPDGVPITSASSSASRKASSTTPRAVKHSSQSTKPRAFELFRDGASLEDVQTETSRARSTVVGYLAEFIQQEGLTDPAPWIEIDETVYKRIRDASFNTGIDKLKPIYEALEQDVSYDIIRIVVACMQGKG
jgi:hypothetical protein